MAESWTGQTLHAWPATVMGALGTLGSEFLREWEAQDMRVTLFKLLLLWLVLSLLGIQLAWGFYGNTVTGLYHRPGKWQQTNLSKPTENKERQQQKGLQRHHWVCWFLHWALLLPRPQRWQQGNRKAGPPSPSDLPLAAQELREGRVCPCPLLSTSRREDGFLLSQGSELRRSLRGREADSLFSVLAFSCFLIPLECDPIMVQHSERKPEVDNSIICKGSLLP